MEPLREVVIDADGIVYSAAFAADAEPIYFCLSTVKRMIKNVISETRADHATLLLTGKDNFRNDLATIQKYKGNRDGVEKPRHYQNVRDYMVRVWGATIVDGMEADDAVGMLCSSGLEGTDFILSSADKDLRMIPGDHFNWQKKAWEHVNEKQGWIFFLTQLLTGDSGDNIPGLFKLTKTKASAKAKNDVEQRVMNAGSDWKQEGFNQVFSIYCVSYNLLHGGSMLTDDISDWATGVLNEIGDLLWIRRQPNQTFRDYMNGDKESKEGSAKEQA